MCGKSCSIADSYVRAILADSRLAVSQFTLHASLKKGNKPDFHQSASGEKAKSLYGLFYKRVGELYEADKIKDGVFAAMMDVALVNDGPVVTSRTAHASHANPRIRSLSRSIPIRPR